MDLDDYIYKYYRNNKTAFAAVIGRSPQLVGHYVKQGYKVVNGLLVDVKLELPEVKEK